MSLCKMQLTRLLHGDTLLTWNCGVELHMMQLLGVESVDSIYASTQMRTMPLCSMDMTLITHEISCNSCDHDIYGNFLMLLEIQPSKPS